MRRVRLLACALVMASVASLLPVQPLAARQTAPPAATCEEAAIKSDSYKLTTDAQAMNVLRPRAPWWEPYAVWKEPREIGDLNQGSVRLAERAKELDERNLLAHGYLARQFVVMAVDAQKAEDAWTRVLDNGGAIVWTATLYDVDARSFFVLAFDRLNIRIFRFAQLAGELRSHFGVPDFPGRDRVEFWRALGGCLPTNAVPGTEIPWSHVREIRATRSTLRFELRDKVTIASDRGGRRTDEAVEIDLHGQTGDVDFRFGMTPFASRLFSGRPVGLDPAAYQSRVRQMLLKFFDPEKRIETTRH
ncbi:MAG: hypothetical protein H0W08_01035 [Acidobacteria bacterium]|nr:hypothetical protein [Acidobacteriota bacterium]